MHAYRTHHCAELRKVNVGATVRLSGWVHRKRDHGHLLFVDVRDHHGITQVVADIDSPAFKVLDRIRVESVVTVEGHVVARGLTNYSSAELERVKGLKSEKISQVLGHRPYEEVIHRDNLALVKK